MVVEEALNNGVPVLVSDRVGCAEELIVGRGVGLIFKTDDADDFFNKIRFFSNPDFYNKLRKNISQQDAEAVESRQVACYLTTLSS